MSASFLRAGELAPRAVGSQWTFLRRESSGGRVDRAPFRDDLAASNDESRAPSAAS